MTRDLGPIRARRTALAGRVMASCVTMSCALVMLSCASAKDASPGESTRARGSAAGPGGSNGSQLADSVAPAAPPGEPASSFPSPSRPVANIVAPRWTNEDARDDAGEFDRVATLSAIGAGTRVADIGAGDGYYVVRLAAMVGPTGRVYAEDIVGDYLRLLQDRVRRERLGNVQMARGEAHDPRLPASDLDVALMIHMYHEIDQPFGLLYNLAPSLKPGGRLVILDLDRPTFGHGTPPSLLRCELAAVGYRELSLSRTGGEEYVAIFQAPASEARPTPAAIQATLTASPCQAPTR